MLAHDFWRPFGDQPAAGFTPLGSQVDQPVGRADHVQVVLDDDQRMPGLNQLAQRAHEFGDVIKVQAGGGLVQQEQGAAVRAQGQRLAADAGDRRLGLALADVAGQKAGELQALRLAARQRGHRLAELDVFKPHIDDGLQGANHLAVVGEQLAGLADGEVKHIGHIEHDAAAVRVTPLDPDFENFGPVALAVAVGAAQVHVAEELHLDMLKARAAAGRAAAVAAVEAELRSRVASLTRQRRQRKNFPHRVPGTHIAGRVGPGGLADR